MDRIEEKYKKYKNNIILDCSYSKTVFYVGPKEVAVVYDDDFAEAVEDVLTKDVHTLLAENKRLRDAVKKAYELDGYMFLKEALREDE